MARLQGTRSPIRSTLQHRFVTVGDMRTVILGERPAALEALIESRRATGADRNDEVWAGDYHMNPAPRKRHAILHSRVTQILGPLARRRQLVVSADFNLGDPDDYRIPDAGLHRDDTDAVYVDTAALVVEILSPHDESWEKVPFYAIRGVAEVMIVDPSTRSLTWLRLRAGRYEATDKSELLGIDVADFARQIDWPSTDD